MSASKVRVALVGLNAPPPGTPGGTNWAANGHLPYLLSSDKYELVALQNSSAERAVEAIKAYGLDPKKTKAYGTAEGMSLANYCTLQSNKTNNTISCRQRPQH